jgi:hypothetical protein
MATKSCRSGFSWRYALQTTRALRIPRFEAGVSVWNRSVFRGVYSARRGRIKFRMSKGILFILPFAARLWVRGCQVVRTNGEARSLSRSRPGVLSPKECDVSDSHSSLHGPYKHSHRLLGIIHEVSILLPSRTLQHRRTSARHEWRASRTARRLSKLDGSTTFQRLRCQYQTWSQESDAQRESLLTAIVM